MNFLVRPIASPEIAALYGVCVAQARQPFFYADLHAPDTVDGRFDLLIAHVLLVIQRLQAHPKETQQLFDILFADMDKNLRELGVSDIRISKKMKPLLSAFYGRAKVYEEALAKTDETLADALRRNIYGATPAAPDDVQRLTAYIRSAHAALAAQKTDDLLSGEMSFPSVAQNG
ncbi:MAG: ubiquinol-cytochrome C chaperone family protein [Alphaproteobacteria bacterium]